MNLEQIKKHIDGNDEYLKSIVSFQTKEWKISVMHEFREIDTPIYPEDFILLGHGYCLKENYDDARVMYQKAYEAQVEEDKRNESDLIKFKN